MILSNGDFDAKITLETDSNSVDEDLPFHILLLGDWSGRENHPQNSALPDPQPIEIDRDNFNDVMKKLNVRLDLDFQGNSVNLLSIEFRELDDFHPDKLFYSVPVFKHLRDTRQKLINKDTFDEAAKEVRSWLINSKTVENNEIEATTNSSESNQSTQTDLLEQIFNETEKNISNSRTQTTEKSELSVLIGEIVKPYLIHTDREEQSKLLIVIDEVISDLMRNILHHPQFQALESSWRAMHLLTRRVETSAHLKLFLLDISKSEISINLKSDSNLSNSNLYRLIAETPQSWAILCGNYTFELITDDIATLVRLAELGNTANAPFISHIKPKIFGFESFITASASDKWHINKDTNEVKLWNALRSFPEVTHLGLVTPRFFVRLPYGENTEPIEAFNFEEFTFPINPEHYVWANPSFICALLLAQSFEQYGWNLQQNLLRDLHNLPIHLYQDENETKAKPCIEIVLTDSNYEMLIEQGLMPIVSFLNSDKLRLGNFQSIAFPASTLKGRWN